MFHESSGLGAENHLMVVVEWHKNHRKTIDADGSCEKKNITIPLLPKNDHCSPLDFEPKVWSRFWSWSSGKIWRWSLFSILLLMFCKGNEAEPWSRFRSKVWSISWTLSWVEMLMFAVVEISKLVLGHDVNFLKMTFDQILCLNCRYD